jgi:tripartite-type tricarboxylate transporter receptor subunit TctC
MRRTATFIAAMLATAVPHFAAAQNYPERPVRIVTAEAGGGADYTARVIAQGLTTELGQQVIVDNRRGGAGIIAIDTAAKAAHDGYTMLVYNNGLWILSLIKKLPYDPVADFSPVTAIVSMPNLLVVHPSLPVKSARELIALAKSKPGELTFASAGTGSTSNLSAELFKAMAGVNLIHVPYKGSASALNELIGGQVQIMFPNATSVMPHVKAGRLRALGVTSLAPSKLFPDLPPIAESGLPGFQSVVIFGLYVPAKTPPAIVNRLNKAVAQILSKPDVKEKFQNVGAETVGNRPAELADTIKSEMARLAPVIKNAGIRED